MTWIETYFSELPTIPKRADEICPCPACKVSENTFKLKPTLERFIANIDWAEEARQLAAAGAIHENDSQQKRIEAAWMVVAAGMARLMQLTMESMPINCLGMMAEGLDMVGRVFDKKMKGFLDFDIKHEFDSNGALLPDLPSKKVIVH